MLRKRAKVRTLSAATHQQAYDLWAQHFSDPALMANRDARTTACKLSRVAERLPLTSASSVLDVGPGDGTLFRIIADQVGRCCGVDPSHAAIARLRRLHADLTNVEFTVGAADSIPYPERTFDIVVINSVLQSLASRAAIENAMRELVRVCKPGGAVFVGELPFRSELGNGFLAHAWRKLRESGTKNFVRLIWTVYTQPVLRGEPLLKYPGTNLFVPADEFVRFCQDLGFTAYVSRHREMRRQSMTRNDYLLRLPAA